MRNPERRPLIRIVSANLASGRADASSFARLVESLSPDVVAVQELARWQAQALAAVLPFGRLESRPHRMGIALRQPACVRNIPLAGRDAFAADVSTVSGESLTVVNAHIIAPHMGLPWRVAALRDRQVRGLEAYLRSAPRPLLLVGDLNSTPLWPAYRRLTAFLTDAAVATARLDQRRPRRTWGIRYGPRLFRIDHVLVAGVVVDRVQVLPVAGSNHYAVVVDVREPE